MNVIFAGGNNKDQTYSMVLNSPASNIWVS